MLTVEPQIIERYVRPGQVKLVFRDVLSHSERSERTSEAAVGAGLQGQFWAMHELLFTEQGQVERLTGEPLLRLMLDFGAKLPVLDQAAYAKGLTERTALAAIKAADADQRKRGISSQPIFEIGDQRLFGLQSFEGLQRVIEAALR